MKVPLLDLVKQYETIRDDARRVMLEVCDSQRFILGPEVEALEREIAAYTDTRFGIGVSSGTDALLVALMAADVGPGDEVITTPFSFFATAGVISRLGATPVFVDIDPATFNMDARLAVAAITERTKAIIPVHLYGRMAELDPLMTAAAEHGLMVIEDAAQAIGARDEQGRAAGSVGHVGCYSFFPSKNLGGFGDGGMVVVAEDEALAHRIRILRVHGSEPKYYHRFVGGNFRLDALQAAILRVKLPHLDDWAAGRRRNADRYRELFAEAGLDEQVRLPGDTPGHIYNQFVIRVADRDGLRKALTDAGVGTEIYYPLPLHLQECFADLGYGAGDMPEAEAAAADSLALPIYPELTAEQQRWVVDSIRKHYAGRAGVAATVGR